MLQLQHIYKSYTTGELHQRALEDINLGFRRSEFVAVAGVSGSGKTTLLNLIGGLDQYDKGDLIINGVSTKEYRDRDWDAYRNHSVGFVFQSYNLIPHQTVLANVELALTLSGVSKAERRKRASDMLERVGLGDQLHKRPNQMSGGQMQRVAIARALINDPEILLADEPTGALDTETSLQIMALLSEIAADRLVIMVTHNMELAQTYASRIVQLRDGAIISDSNPYDAERDATAEAPKAKTSMSFWTAISLSLNNLLTKKTRTILTAFAGSIGIIGIALILALQSGVQSFISRVEQDTLSTYPLTIESQAVDMSGLRSIMGSVMLEEGEEPHPLDAVYENRMMTDMFSLMTTQMTHNDLGGFKAYIDANEGGIQDLTTAVQYGYSLDLQIYKGDTADGVFQVNPTTIFDNLGMGSMVDMATTMGPSQMMSMQSSMIGLDVWTELLGNEALLRTQYDVVTGRWPEAFDEVVLVLNERNEISELTLYSLGLKDASELSEMMARAMMGASVTLHEEPARYTYDELMALSFKMVLPGDVYEESGGQWIDRRGDAAYMEALLADALALKIVGILRPNADAVSASINGTVGYTSALTTYVINSVNDSEIVKQQLANPETDVFSGLAFDGSDAPAQTSQMPSLDDLASMPGMDMLTDAQKAQLAALSPEQLMSMMERFAPQVQQPAAVTTTYAENLETLGVVNLENPSTISIYPIDFAAKEGITDAIDAYNRARIDAGEENMVITYTDIMGLLLSSVTTIVNAISYVLIAFVAISLVVSSIMIGIITYISVLERTKEIGILRSIGASKRDISRVFNAETLIVGLVSGLLGVGITLLLSIPINAIIYSLAGIANVAALPARGAVILVALSVILTVIAGLIPSRLAAKKDPVAALRSE